MKTIIHINQQYYSQIEDREISSELEVFEFETNFDILPRINELVEFMESTKETARLENINYSTVVKVVRIIHHTDGEVSLYVEPCNLYGDVTDPSTLVKED